MTLCRLESALCYLLNEVKLVVLSVSYVEDILRISNESFHGKMQKEQRSPLK